MMSAEIGPFIALKNGPTKIIKSNGGGFVGIMMWPSVHVAGAFSHGLTPMSATQEDSAVREVCVCVCARARARARMMWQKTVVFLLTDVDEAELIIIGFSFTCTHFN